MSMMNENGCEEMVASKENYWNCVLEGDALNELLIQDKAETEGFYRKLQPPKIHNSL